MDEMIRSIHHPLKPHAMKILQIPLAMLVSLALLGSGCKKTEVPATGNDLQLKGKPVIPTGYPMADNPTQLQVYGVWHAGNDYCTWGTVRSTADDSDFDKNNLWIIDRDLNPSNGYNPSVNVVVLSFVNPLKLLNQTTDGQTLNGIPKGMTQEVVTYFKSHGIRVMLSIGGITYTNDWNAALAQDATQLGLNAAAAASALGVGIEIDYEENSSPNLAGLQAFIDAYRGQLAYDATGVNHAARLTIDLAAGDRWLIAICRKATADWLRTDTPVLDYANAMVPARQPSASEALANWYEHIEGKAQYAPPIPPLAPCKFTGSLYITGSKPIPECVNFDSSIEYIDRDFVRRILPKDGSTGTTAGMLGYMFWAAECPSTRQLCTTGTNSCNNGVGKGATFFNIPIPMTALRQN
jgi:hypothetical protein